MVPLSRLLSIASLFFLLSCRPNQPIPQDTVVIGIEAPFLESDPRLARDAASQKINDLVFSGLLKKDESLNLIPDLASTYTIVDPQTYIFTLKSPVYFHDLKKLTSFDVKATYASMMAKESTSTFKASLGIIDKIETPDELTIVFKLKEPNSPFLTLMSLNILPEGYVKDEKTKPLVGTGAYKHTVSSSEREDFILLERFDAYHEGMAANRFLKFRVIQDNTLRTLELLKGRLDLLQNTVPFVLTPVLEKEASLKKLSAAGVNFTYMGFNFKNPYLKDLLVRRAIALAIDRDRLIKYKLVGLARPATSVLSPTHWAHDQDLKPLPYDLNEAKKLLDSSPFADPDGDGPASRFTLIYKTSSEKERVEIAQLIAENLKKIGIDVVVKSYEFGTFFRDIQQGDFDLYTLTWVGLTDADIYHYIGHSENLAPHGGNRGFYVNPKLDALLDESRLLTEQDHLKEVYKKIQAIFYEDLVYAPLWYEDNVAFMRKGVHGYSLKPNASFGELWGTHKGELMSPSP